MSIGIGENLTASFGFAKDKLGGSPVTWLILSILNLVPIVDWIVYGVYVKFVDGLLALIIGLIYMIVPIILIIVVSVGMFIFGSVTVTPGDPSVSGISEAAGFAVMFGLIILCIIVAFLFSLLATPAVVNFARKGFCAAFRIGELVRMIGKAGLLKYIVSLILLWIIFCVIVFICMLIPIIGWIVLIFVLPFLYFWASKYLANLFE